MEKKLDGNYTKMLQAILNKSWRQHPTKQQLYGHIPPITKTKLDKPDMQDTAGEVETRSQVIYSNGHLNMAVQKQGGQLEPTYSSCVDMRRSPGDLPEAINDKEGWQQGVREFCADGMT